jgi:hypothetical protein
MSSQVTRTLERATRFRVAGSSAVALVIVIAALAIFQATTPASGVITPSKVQLVNSSGTPLKIVNGGLTQVNQIPGSPLHLQKAIQTVPTGPSGMALTAKIASTKSFDITSFTLTCVSCNDAAGASPMIRAILWSGTGDCSFSGQLGPSNLVLEVVASQSQPSVDFTFPTPRVAPVVSTGSPSCLGLQIDSASGVEKGFVTLDGWVSG